MPSLGAGLLADAVLVQPAAQAAGGQGRRLDHFLKEPAHGLGLCACGWVPPAPRRPCRLSRSFAALSRDIAGDRRAAQPQVNAILHHRSSRTGVILASLRIWSSRRPRTTSVKIRVLNVSWKELTRICTVRPWSSIIASSFARSTSDEFGLPGGQPFGVLIGDYEIRHRMSPIILTTTWRPEHISGVAAAAFAPFIAAAHPSLLELTVSPIWNGP